MSEKQEDKSTWAIGGGVVLGVGVGFFVLEKSGLLFTGCILAGLGLGMITTAILSRKS